MRQIPTAIVLAAAATFSVTPHSFTAGRSVIAQEMNENFAAVDSALQNRATKSDLASKIDTSALTKKADLTWATKAISDTANKVRQLIPNIDLSTKADTSKTNPVSRKVDALAASKQDNLGYTPYKPGDALPAIKVGCGLIQPYAPSSFYGSIYGDSLPETPGQCRRTPKVIWCWTLLLVSK